MSHISIKPAESEEDWRRCYPVMVQLRPTLTEEEFVERTARQNCEGGYALVMLEEGDRVRAVAGYRTSENLFSGRHIYVDDLVTDESSRSSGFGGQLLDWLVQHARETGCAMFELDSGVQRSDAHRFYFRHGMHIVSFRFRLKLE